MKVNSKPSGASKEETFPPITQQQPQTPQQASPLPKQQTNPIRLQQTTSPSRGRSGY